MDLYSKAIVGWSMSHRITRDIVLKALLMAIAAKRPDSGLLHHSDRGSRYATRQEARLDVFDYIERFYNRRRPHGAVGRMSPLEYEAKTLNRTGH